MPSSQTGESIGRAIQTVRLLPGNPSRRTNLLESPAGRARRISLPHHINRGRALAIESVIDQRSREGQTGESIGRT